MTIEWKPELALGHAQIDADHRELFRRTDALVEALTRGERSEVALLFEFLQEYVVRHFGEEERLMRESAFGGARVHEAAHARFVRELAELRALFDQAGATPGIAVRTSTWVVDWLERHIAGVDQAFAAHLRARAG